jgi:GT2 family glycosyltransferase
MSAAGISVVIPNYNGEKLLPQVLPTVYAALNNISIASEIIICDDCSTDETILLLHEKFPGVKVLQNEVNSGFSITANKGIRAARYDWVLLLNSDVKLEPGYFKPLLKYMDRKDVFGVMGRIIGWEDNNIQDGAKYPFFHGVKIKTSGNYLLQDEAAMQNGIYSMYLSGANAFMNKEYFISIGGLNELFSPFYIEDFELSLRAWRLGYTCFYEHNAICRHKTSTTIVSTRKKKQVKKIYNRNKMYLHAIHLDQPNRFLWYLQLIPETIGYFFMLRWSYFQALGLFIRNYRGVKRSREALGQLSKTRKLLSVNQVVDRIKSSIQEKEINRF